MSRVMPREALIISPSFFGYQVDIVAELVAQGFKTTFLDERPSNSAVARAVLRVRKNLVGRQIEEYFHRKARELSGIEFSLVIVIKGEVLPRWFLEEMRFRNPDARFVFYTYDAIDNAPNCLGLLDLFDERLSFDRADIERRSDFVYLPLFYTPDFASRADIVPPSCDFELAFIGTLHSDRYRFAKSLFGPVENVYGFFYIQARWYFMVVKYLTREHAGVPWKDISFTAMTRSQIADVFGRSHAVLDMQRGGQAGLTMRTFEVLASGSILVTTNRAICREPFFDPTRIVVVPEFLDEVGADQVRARIRNLSRPSGPPIGFDSYTLSNWVRRLTAAGRGL